MKPRSHARLGARGQLLDIMSASSGAPTMDGEEAHAAAQTLFTSRAHPETSYSSASAYAMSDLLNTQAVGCESSAVSMDYAKLASSLTAG